MATAWVPTAFGDAGDDGFAGGELQFHLGADRAFLDGRHGALEHIAGADFHGEFSWGWLGK